MNKQLRVSNLVYEMLVEVGKKLVILALGNGIILVVMAACASNGQAKKDCAERINTVNNVLGTPLLGN